MDAGLLRGGHEQVVAAHEVGAGHPADAGLGEADVLGPAGLGVPLGEDRVECGLDLAVGPVATEGAAVRGAGQDDVGAGADGAGRRESGEPGDGAFDGPEQQAGLVLGGPSGVGERSGDPGRGEREREGRDECGLGHGDLLPDGDLLLGADPVDQGVDVPEGGHVGGHEPEPGAGGGVRRVEAARVLLAGLRDAGGGHDDRRPALEQAGDDGTGDGAGRRAGDQCDLPVELGGEVASGGLGDAGENPATGLVVGALRPPAGLPGHGLPGAREAGDGGGVVGGRVDTGGEAGEFLAGDRPAVVEEHGPLRVEHRGDEFQPLGAELRLDGLEQGPVRGTAVGRLGRRGEPQGVEDGAGGFREDTVRSGDGVGVGVEGRGIDHSPATTGRSTTEGDLRAVRRGDGTDGGVDEGVEVGRRRRLRAGQGTQLTAPHRFLGAGAEDEFHLDGGDPAGGQTPGSGDPVADVGRLGPRLRCEGAQAGAGQFGEHRAEGRVAGGGGGHAGLQRGDVRLGGAVDRGDAEFGGHVHQQLVPPRGDAVGQCLGGVGAGDLLGAQLVLHREQGDDRVGRGEVQFGRGSRGLPT